MIMIVAMAWSQGSGSWLVRAVPDRPGAEPSGGAGHYITALEQETHRPALPRGASVWRWSVCLCERPVAAAEEHLSFLRTIKGFQRGAETLQLSFRYILPPNGLGGGSTGQPIVSGRSNCCCVDLSA